MFPDLDHSWHGRTILPMLFLEALRLVVKYYHEPSFPKLEPGTLNVTPMESTAVDELVHKSSYQLIYVRPE